MSDSESDYSDSDDGGGRKGPRMKEREWDDARMRRALRMLHAHEQLYGTRLGPEKAAEKVEWPGMESSVRVSSSQRTALASERARTASLRPALAPHTPQASERAPPHSVRARPTHAAAPQIYRASKELYAIEGNGAREAFIAAWTKPKKGIERYGAD